MIEVLTMKEIRKGKKKKLYYKRKDRRKDQLDKLINVLSLKVHKGEVYAAIYYLPATN